MTLHELKTWPEYFRATLSGLKKFEIRKNDRKFKVGDTLILFEFDPKERKRKYTGRHIRCKIIYLLDDPKFIKEGFIVMSIEIESLDGLSRSLDQRCRNCGNKMEMKGDMRYEDLYWKCPICGWEKQTIIRG